MSGMTRLLEKAIEKVRELPAEDQDAVAVAVLSMAEETPIVALEVLSGIWLEFVRRSLRHIDGI